MKITIQTDTGEREIEMKPVKGKHLKKLWRFYIDLQKGDTDGFEKLLHFLDTLVSELTGLTVDELDELPADEKLKLTSIPQTKAFEMVNFTKLSQMPDSSSVRAIRK